MAGAGRARPLLADVVRSQLRQAILSGEFPLGAKLPNEDQLRARFAVSRITLREAVSGLIEDGFLVRRQGSGTYVTHRPTLRNSLDTNFSYTAFLESCGSKVDKKIVGVRTVPADGELAELLGLQAGAPLVEVRRIRTADGHPAIYSIDAIPADIVDGTQDRAAFRGSLYRLLAERGHPVGHADAVLAPVLADRRLAQLLDVADGTALQHLTQVDVDTAGRPVMHSQEWHVPSVIELRVYRRGPGPHLQP